jgi:hypothetical protein
MIWGDILVAPEKPGPPRMCNFFAATQDKE